MSLINAALRVVFDVLLYPFRELPPLVGLTLVSLATGVGMLLIFKATSDQAALAAVKRRIHACLFEIRLFNDDLRAILRAQGEILRHNLAYLRLSLAPLVWMILPLVLAIAQLQFHYAYAGLEPGESAVVKVTLRADRSDADPAVRPAAELVAPEGLQVETPAVWIPSQRELAWRIAAQRAGDYQLRVRVNGSTDTKAVRVSDAVVRRSPVRVNSSWLDQLIYPAEAPLPSSSPLEAISISYPDRDVWLFGWGVHWMVVFFVLSMVFAFALRNRLGVTI
jgi:uncharacterized membrane protein (DUF106 family)